jgi:hypothetical protein
MPSFVIKVYVHAFIMGEGMGDVPAFMIKGDASLETSLFCFHN